MAENKQLFHNIVVGGKNKKSDRKKNRAVYPKQKKKTIEDIHQWRKEKKKLCQEWDSNPRLQE